MNVSPHYTFGTVVNRSLPEARELVTEALKAEGFGVLTEIDVRATLKNKLDIGVECFVDLFFRLFIFGISTSTRQNSFTIDGERIF